MVALITSIDQQSHLYLRNAKRTVQSLMAQCFYDVRHCEQMIEAENDRLHQQLASVSRVVENHKVSRIDGCGAMKLIEAALTREETGRDLEAFGKRYAARNTLQIKLQTVVETMLRDFAWITEAMERQANTQLQAMIDVSSAIERELEEDIERLVDQLKNEKHETSKLKAEIQGLSSSYGAHHIAALREIDRLQRLLEREHSQKREMELDSDVFREKYEAQQWSAYQGAAELTHVQAELNATQLNQVFLKIENDQLQQHMRALSATVEYLIDGHGSSRLIDGDVASGTVRNWSEKPWPRTEVMPSRDDGRDYDQNEVLSKYIVCVDDIGLDQLISYLDSKCVVTCPTWSAVQGFEVGEENDAFVVIAESNSDYSESEFDDDKWRFPASVICIEEVCTEVTLAYF